MRYIGNRKSRVVCLILLLLPSRPRLAEAINSIDRLQLNSRTMIDKIVKNRILIAASCYLAYASLFGYEGRRFLSSSKTGRPLEFVHITHTGGLTVEKAGADAKINWGACHYMAIDEAGCSEPDLKFEGGGENNFMLHNIWHTPPKYLIQFDPDMNRNPYRGKDLFALVRNPYTR